MGDIFGKIRKFIAETMAEMRKCTWPTRNELFESTILVIVSILILASFVAIVDEISRFIFKHITTM
jgi:preprotein translocase subunit SecE